MPIGKGQIIPSAHFTIIQPCGWTIFGSDRKVTLAQKLHCKKCSRCSKSEIDTIELQKWEIGSKVDIASKIQHRNIDNKQVKDALCAFSKQISE